MVIGAGVSGLSSGIRLLENGWKVTIWSTEFSPNTTSDIAAALWYPFLSAEKEHIQERPLVHNYGHGGSGVTLSWGCADEVVELVNGG